MPDLDHIEGFFSFLESGGVVLAEELGASGRRSRRAELWLKNRDWRVDRESRWWRYLLREVVAVAVSVVLVVVVVVRIARSGREEERMSKLYILDVADGRTRQPASLGRDRRHKRRPRACVCGQEDTSRIEFEVREGDSTASKVTDEGVPCLESKTTGPRWETATGYPKQKSAQKERGVTFRSKLAGEMAQVRNRLPSDASQLPRSAFAEKKHTPWKVFF